MTLRFQNILFSVFISIMLLTPILNIPLISTLKSLDFYINFIFLLYLFYKIHKEKKIDKTFLFIQFSLFFLVLYLLILELIFELNDYSAITFLFRSLLTIGSSYASALLLYKFQKNNSIFYFGVIIFICAILQGIVIWLSFLSNPFRDLMSLFFYRDFSNDNQHLIMLRVPGFVDSGGDGLSMNHGLLCVVGFITMIIHDKSKDMKFSLILISLFAAIACLFTGRTGLYLSLFFIIISISLFQKGKFSFYNLPRFFLIILIILSFFIISANSLGAYGTELKNEYGFEHPVVRFLKGFMSFSEGEVDSYQDDTIISLTSDHVVFPKSPIRLLFGNNSFGTPNDPVLSDVGYIRYIHGMGLIGLFYIISFFLICYILIRKLLKKTSFPFCFNNSISYMLFIILGYGFIGHYKIYYLTSRVFLFIFFTYFFIILNEYKSHKNQTHLYLSN